MVPCTLEVPVEGLLPFSNASWCSELFLEGIKDWSHIWQQISSNGPPVDEVEEILHVDERGGAPEVTLVRKAMLHQARGPRLLEP